MKLTRIEFQKFSSLFQFPKQPIFEIFPMANPNMTLLPCCVVPCIWTGLFWKISCVKLNQANRSLSNRFEVGLKRTPSIQFAVWCEGAKTKAAPMCSQRAFTHFNIQVKTGCSSILASLLLRPISDVDGDKSSPAIVLAHESIHLSLLLSALFTHEADKGLLLFLVVACCAVHLISLAITCALKTEQTRCRHREAFWYCWNNVVLLSHLFT